MWFKIFYAIFIGNLFFWPTYLLIQIRPQMDIIDQAALDAIRLMALACYLTGIMLLWLIFISPALEKYHQRLISKGKSKT